MARPLIPGDLFRKRFGVHPKSLSVEAFFEKIRHLPIGGVQESAGEVLDRYLEKQYPQTKGESR